jgi:hypothetical protein
VTLVKKEANFKTDSVYLIWIYQLAGEMSTLKSLKKEQINKKSKNTLAKIARRIAAPVFLAQNASSVWIHTKQMQMELV